MTATLKIIVLQLTCLIYFNILNACKMKLFQGDEAERGMGSFFCKCKIYIQYQKTNNKTKKKKKKKKNKHRNPALN